MVEATCTFIFVMANLLVKDAQSGFPGRENGALNGWMGCFTIAAALAGMIAVAGPHSGASLNPAVSVALHVLKDQVLKRSVIKNTFRIYFLGPILGAVVAGLFSWGHRAMLAWIEELKPEEDE